MKASTMAALFDLRSVIATLFGVYGLVLTVLGLLGLLMREAGVPVAPAVVGLILAPLAEQQLRRALALSEGDWGTLVSSPLTVILWTVVVLALAGPPLFASVKKHRRHIDDLRTG